MGNKNSSHNLARTRVVIDLRLLLQMATTLKPILPLSRVKKASLTTIPIPLRLLPAVCSSGVRSKVPCQNSVSVLGEVGEQVGGRFKRYFCGKPEGR